MKSTPVLFIAALIAALSPKAGAVVRPNPLFSTGAVLQQDAAVPVWGTATEGEAVTVEFDGQTASTTAKDGKWQVVLKPHKAGGPFVLTIKGENTLSIQDVLVGEVWICSGQSNMAYALSGASTAATERPKANYPQLRMFTVSHAPSGLPLTEVTGKWSVCSPGSAGSFSAVGYFFGRDIHKATGVPVGMISSSVGGTPAQAWTSLAGLEKEPSLKSYVDAATAIRVDYPEKLKKYTAERNVFAKQLAEWNDAGGKAYEAALKAWPAQNKAAVDAGKPAIPKPEFAQPKPANPTPPYGGSTQPTVLFNGMIAPLVPYAIKGAIWYQGEANAGNGRGYRKLFPALIADWRAQWAQGDFPFFFVQIAPHNAMTPELREAQLLTSLNTPNTAMAVITDYGTPGDIHPKNKEPVGVRLALAARALTYGEKIEYSGPVYDSLTIDGARAVLHFTHVGGGLVAKGGELKGFTVAGADNAFVKAKAEIVGDTVVVSAEGVTAPAAVRFGWANVPEVNFYNRDGLPASPFRTDPDSQK